MSDPNDTTNTALIVTFGIFTIIVTIAGFHVRDSVFCSACRGLLMAWSRGSPQVDIEAVAGTESIREFRDDAVFELQPRLSLPLYYEASVDNAGQTRISS